MAPQRPAQGADREAARLLLAGRWAALATLDGGGAPQASMVAYAPAPDLAGLVLHLSRLAPHTRHLLARPACALVVSAADGGARDPQTLPRVSLAGTAVEVAPESPQHPALRALYLRRLPAAAPRFGFADFVLFHLVPAQARYVGGFARAFTLAPESLRAAALEVAEG